MSNEPHDAKITNSLKNTSVDVFIKEENQNRRGAFQNNKSLLEQRSSKALIGFAGKSNIHLIIRAKMVPNSNSGDDGLKIVPGSKLSPHHVEIRSVSGNTFELDLHFENVPKSKNGIITHIDPDIQHPSG